MINRLEPEMIVLRQRIQEIQSSLIISNEWENEAEKNHDQLEHTVSVLEDLCAIKLKGIEQRVELVEKNVEMLHKYLNNEDLRCKEELNDSDEEFDFTDFSYKIDEEIKRVEQMGNETIE